MTFRFNSKGKTSAGGSFDPVPPGWYTVQVVGSQETASKDGHKALSFEYEITGMDHNGRKFFDWFQVEHPNQQAVDIANGRLADLTRAIFGNDHEWADLGELHGKSFQVKVGIQPARDGYDAKNRARAFRPAPNTTIPDPKTNPSPYQDDDIPF